MYLSLYHLCELLEFDPLGSNVPFHSFFFHGGIELSFPSKNTDSYDYTFICIMVARVREETISYKWETC